MPEGLLLVVWSSIGLWVVGWVGLWVQSFYSVMGWVEQSFGGLGLVGLKKLDPWTTDLNAYIHVESTSVQLKYSKGYNSNTLITSSNIICTALIMD